MDPSDHASPLPRRHAMLQLCSVLVGAASLTFVVIVGMMLAGALDDPGGLAIGLTVVGLCVGGLAGLYIAERLAASDDPRTEAVATVIYILTILAVPFLFWVAAALALVVLLSGYQF